MTTRYRANFLAGVASGIINDAGQVTFSGSGFPTSIPAGQYLPIILNPGYYGSLNLNGGPEVVYITSSNGSVVSGTRGQEGTATTLASGSVVPWVAGSLVSDFDVSNLTSSGTLTLSGTGGLSVTGASTFNGVADSGITNLTNLYMSNSATITGRLSVTGASTFNGVADSGITNLTNLYMSNSATITGRLSVTGASSFNGISVSGGIISGATINGNSIIVSPTMSGTATNNGTITGGTISGVNINNATISGATFPSGSIAYSSIKSYGPWSSYFSSGNYYNLDVAANNQVANVAVSGYNNYLITANWFVNHGSVNTILRYGVGTVDGFGYLTYTGPKVALNIAGALGADNVRPYSYSALFSPGSTASTKAGLGMYVDNNAGGASYGYVMFTVVGIN